MSYAGFKRRDKVSTTHASADGERRSLLRQTSYTSLRFRGLDCPVLPSWVLPSNRGYTRVLNMQRKLGRKNLRKQKNEGRQRLHDDEKRSVEKNAQTAEGKHHMTVPSVHPSVRPSVLHSRTNVHLSPRPRGDAHMVCRYVDTSPGPTHPYGNFSFLSLCPLALREDLRPADVQVDQVF